jgi:trehalose 6-phosphate synthase
MADAKRKLIVVANRGPVTYTRVSGGARVTKRGAGGLVTALRSLVRRHEVTWVASAISDEDRAVAAEHDGGAFAETWHDGSPYRLRLVSHDREAYEQFYTVAANPTLWFLQHYMWGLAYAPDFDAQRHAAWNDGYVAVNEGFADAVVSELEHEPEAAVFFHDYHLYLAPGVVRTRRPAALISQFVHIPWPENDYWTVLPRELRAAIHEGLLANDIVGLHTNRWRRNFLRTCEDVLAAEVDYETSTVLHNGRRTTATAHAIGVDVAEFEALRDDEAVLGEERRIIERRPELLILRVDRTDPSKNVVRGFRAFGRFLELHPEFHRRVGMLALLDPSRQDIADYVDYLTAIEREAASVNGRFERDSWKPIDLQVADNFAQSVAAYKQFDALLVNPVFDGLNLVSKEAPLVNDRDGILILSENAGSHEELEQWALTVNPFDIEGQAAAIYRAVTMTPTERRSRLAGIRAHVRANDVTTWIDAQLGDLDRASSRARA